MGPSTFFSAYGWPAVIQRHIKFRQSGTGLRQGDPPPYLSSESGLPGSWIARILTLDFQALEADFGA